MSASPWCEHASALWRRKTQLAHPARRCKVCDLVELRSAGVVDNARASDARSTHIDGTARILAAAQWTSAQLEANAVDVLTVEAAVAATWNGGAAWLPSGWIDGERFPYVVEGRAWIDGAERMPLGRLRRWMTTLLTTLPSSPPPFDGLDDDDDRARARGEA